MSTGGLKKILLRLKLIENKCYECGLGPEWNGKKLVMVLDHKNGMRNDHRLENLWMLCPNCNAQQPTFCTGSKNPSKIKVALPDKEQFTKDFYSMSTFELVKKYEVHNGTLNRWRKLYSLDKKPRGVHPARYRKKADRGTLLEEVQIFTVQELSELYNVKDKTIELWIRDYGLQDYKKIPNPVCSNKNCELRVNEESHKYCSPKCGWESKEQYSDVDVEKFKEQVHNLPMTKVAAIYGVSATCIKKWCLRFDIELETSPVIFKLKCYLCSQPREISKQDLITGVRKKTGGPFCGSKCRNDYQSLLRKGEIEAAPRYADIAKKLNVKINGH